ncbi:MAG: FixH family protein [Arcobacter sp.]|uniref:FixH family protein n=1 Tax=Arcobacter sp. TaxID=1872629 RepID=UPI003C74AAA8
MKNVFKLFAGLLIAFNLVHADPLLQEGSKDGYDVKLSSEKSLVMGSNEIIIELAKDGADLSNTKVKIKFFMPEMPGMPYMESEVKGKIVDGKFKASVNFAMGGTWQYQLKFKTEDGKVHTVRGSVNI